MNRTALILAALMLASSVFAIVLKPNQIIADRGPKLDLETMIPSQFGDWHMEQALDRLMVSPDVQANLDKIYNQILSRTYISGRGERIMLSIAYGADQRSGPAMAVHYPEVCYPAQGFEVDSNQIGTVETIHGVLPVRRLETRQGTRIESVTYWIRLGTQITLSEFDRRMIELRWGLKGEIPDGLLFRVSSIGRDSPKAFSIQEGFIKDLLHYLPAEDRIHLAGNEMQ